MKLSRAGRKIAERLFIGALVALMLSSSVHWLGMGWIGAGLESFARQAYALVAG
jgi:hypothetical protein